MNKARIHRELAVRGPDLKQHGVTSPFGQNANRYNIHNVSKTRKASAAPAANKGMPNESHTY